MALIKTVKCKVCDGAGKVPEIQPKAYRIIRERAKIGLRKAARKAGCNFAHLSRVERGERKSTPEIDRFYGGLVKGG